jgi:hypothetical protein
VIEARCERPGCPTTAATDDIYRNPPDGWVQVKVRGEAHEHDYCSLACAVHALAERDTERPLPFRAEVAS